MFSSLTHNRPQGGSVVEPMRNMWRPQVGTLAREEKGEEEDPGDCTVLWGPGYHFSLCLRHPWLPRKQKKKSHLGPQKHRPGHFCSYLIVQSNTYCHYGKSVTWVDACVPQTRLVNMSIVITEAVSNDNWILSSLGLFWTSLQTYFPLIFNFINDTQMHFYWKIIKQ